MSISDEVSQLYAVSDDHETSVLDRLRRRAGLVWEHWGCWTNDASSVSCERCGVARENLVETDVNEYTTAGED